MSSKRITYLLIGIIALLLILISFSIHNVYKRELTEEERINNLILGFEDKFHKDSLNLAKSNQLLIDQISQHIIDSISIVYEEKLQIALDENEKYKNILLENNITISTQTNKTSNTRDITTSNVTTYTKLPITSKKRNTSSNTNDYLRSSNVTTYSKLPKKSNLSTSKWSNVTTYSKLNKVTNVVRTKPKKTNVTTYSQVNKNANASNKYQKKIIKKNNPSITHNNYDLDNATNINDVQYVPLYSGCETKHTEFDKKNCFATKISMHILTNFNTATVQNTELKRGIKKLRVLFIIDKNGKTRVRKIIGKWPEKISQEVIRSVESVPRMKPGMINGKATTVKYSLLIPFTIS